MEVRPQVHLIDTVKFSNVYILVDEELAVIDTGPGKAEPIMEFISSLGRRPQELSWIFITHGHSDHIGALWELRNKTGAKVVAYKGETACDLRLFGDTMFSYMGGLHIFHTPGHTSGSISLFLEKRGVLFVGDVIDGRKYKSWPDVLEGNQEYWSKLQRKLAPRRVAVCCFGHGPPLYSYA